MAEEGYKHESTPKAEEVVESTDRGLFDFLGKKPAEEEVINKPTAEEGYTHEEPKAEETESTDRGLFGFGKKKPTEEEVIVSEFDNKAKICDEEEVKPEPIVVEEQVKPEHYVVEEKKHESLLEKLHRSDSSSSSSSDEEVEEGGEKKKKKKSLKEKILGEKKEEETNVPVEKYEEEHAVVSGTSDIPEKKGFIEKIKDKLPGHKAPVVAESPPLSEIEEKKVEDYEEPKEKKGFMEKIKEKLPGYHPKTSEEDVIKEKEIDAKTSY
jgi:PHD/YefM family antitoxin component YafN of YafNO toxin-antitoxin module